MALDAKSEALEKVRQIDGWLTDREAGALFDLAATSTGPIVEIGSWRGRSTSALALGSMAGANQPVIAIDSFIGVPPSDRPSATGWKPGWGSSGADILRANLNSIGINGLVRIVPKASAEAAPEIPECGVLFVDGGHDYETVRRDLDLYLPKVAAGGFVMLHDCDDGDLGVVQAADECLMAYPQDWRAVKRVDSAVIFQRRSSQRHTVMLAFPGNSLQWGAAKGLVQATLGANDVWLAQSGMGWDDMNRLWVDALNAQARGEITHFAMLHSDVVPSAGWVDVLVNELDDVDGDLISVVNALKDDRGVTSCGIGDKNNHWEPFRRFTVREILELPETFTVADTPHPERYLLHNTGCLVADLRKPVWRALDGDGCLKACFQFQIRARVLPTGELIHERESEDWYFSRKLAEIGAKTFSTRKVETVHLGTSGYPNSMPWGKYKNGDDDTRAKWGAA